MRALQRSGQPLLADAEGERQGRPAPADAGGAGAARSWHPGDSSLLAPGAGALGMQLGTWQVGLSQGTAPARRHHGRGGEQVSAGALYGRAQPPVSVAGGTSRQPVYPVCAPRSRSRLLPAVGTDGEPRQHGHRAAPHPADRASELARHTGRLQRHGAPASGRILEHPLRAAPAWDSTPAAASPPSTWLPEAVENTAAVPPWKTLRVSRFPTPRRLR